MVNLKSLSRAELIAFVKHLGLPRYRADQLIHWIYQKGAETVEEITEFSKDLRARLSGIARLSKLQIEERLRSRDGTEKFLFRLEDGELIESVLIPDEDRLTLCISSQVGCAMGCRFCLTGQLGLKRNLRAYEIVDQVIAAGREIRPRRITNIVLMGMGEPLANFDEVVEALRRIVDFVGISKRRITLSTAGVVPKMLLLPEQAPDVNLAVSLNATTDKVRNNLMPINRRYPLSDLLEACRRYPLRPRRRITFEYVLISGVNDTDEDARRLVRLLRGMRCKVNLIPLNASIDGDLGRPRDERVLRFQEILVRQGLTALIRESRGQDILAACGQLRGKHENRRFMD